MTLAPNPNPIVLVTGGTGFVGRSLLPLLDGMHVRLAVRDGSRDVGAAERAIVGEIDERTDWQDALGGVDVVVHLAAHVHVMQSTPEDEVHFHRVNALGTERLARAAADHGVRRMVVLSSVKVNGEQTHGVPFGPDDEPHPVDAYGRSKLDAERRLFAVAAASALVATAVRSPLVYGPGVRANFLRLLRSVDRGMPLPFASVHNARSMVSVWNLCDLLHKLVVRPEAVPGVLMVSDGEDLSTAEIVRRLASGLERPARLWAVPPRLLRAVGAVTGRGATVSRLVDSLTVNIEETRRRAQWSPPLGSAEALVRTARWYRSEVGARRV